MKVLVIGAGGREHALVRAIRRSSRVSGIYCAPGNGGISTDAECVTIPMQDSAGLIEFAKREGVELTVIGPELPLTLGLVDDFNAAGLAAVGPRQKAAILEGSKGFAKQFMTRHRIPTARYALVCERSAAEEVLKCGEFPYPVVLKADGLAAGKGVFVAANRSDVDQALAELFDRRSFGSASDSVVIEEGLAGVEVSFMVFSDGERIIPMVAARDHKRIFDGDRGPNTGGMGAYSSDSILNAAERQVVADTIIRRVIDGMAEEGCPFRGFLYAGLMMTEHGPKVLEFNVRMGDPETQVILPRLKSDIVPILEGIAHGKLEDIEPEWSPDPVVTVVLASKGYPDKYETGRVITGLEMASEAGVEIFHSGTERRDGKFFTAGGRVLAVSAEAPSLQEAVLKTYEAVNRIHFEGMHYRRDIAAHEIATVTASGDENE